MFFLCFLSTACKLSRSKHRLFRAAKRDQHHSSWERYKEARNKCNKEFSKVEKKYFSAQQAFLSDISPSSHQCWAKAKQIARISGPQSGVPDLEYSGISATTENEKANLLASFFAEPCTAPTNAKPDGSYGSPLPLHPNTPSFSVPKFTKKDILRILKKLSLHKATGSDNMSCCLLREGASLLSESLHIHIQPFDRHMPISSTLEDSNSRPALQTTRWSPFTVQLSSGSLLPAVGKIMDQLQSKALLSHLRVVNNKLVSAHQFGFLLNRCTTMQLVYILETWLHSLEDGKGTVAIFMDFETAFDRVWHAGLLHKLSLLGLNTSSIDWLNNHLSDRVLHVRVGSALSRTFPLSAGVPQRSHLGPVLFLAFINDLPATIPSSSELYAADAWLH